MPIYLPPLVVPNATTSVPGIVEVDRNALSGDPTAYTKDGLAQTPAIDLTRGLLSVGGSPFDGTSPGHFVGGTFGSDGSTAVAINLPASYSGNVLDFQIDGVNQLNLDVTPNLVLSGTYAGVFASNSALNLGSNLQPGFVTAFGDPTNVSNPRNTVGYLITTNSGQFGSYWVAHTNTEFALTCNAYTRVSDGAWVRTKAPDGASAVNLDGGTVTLRVYAGGAGLFTPIPWVDALTVSNTGAVTVPGTLTAGSIVGPIASASDIPSLDASKITTGTLALARGGTNTDNSSISANLVWAGPGTGIAASASYRALVAADIPALDASKITTGQLALTRGGTGLDTSTVTDGQLLVGQTSDHTFGLATLTAGAGVSITNAGHSITIAATGSGGTVTSVALALPAEFSVSGSPVTGSGTLSAAWQTESANTLLAGPTTGAAATPGFRALVNADIPSPLTIAGAMTAGDFVASGLSGATQASRYVGATASGAPVSGTFALGDFVIDQSGTIWVCTIAGSPGTWSQLIPTSQKSAASGVAALSAQTALTGTTAVAVRCHNSTVISPVNAVDTTLTFDTNEFDQGAPSAQHSTVTNPSRITCQVAGIYVIHASVDFTSNATGARILIIQLNGTTWIAWQNVGANPSNNTALSVSTTYTLSVGDYVEVVVRQTSGIALNLTAWASNQDTPAFGMARVA